MDNRKCIGGLLKLCQWEIERTLCEMDKLDFLSVEWHQKNRENAMQRGYRDGVITTAHMLGIITDDEACMCISDLIDELMK